MALTILNVLGLIFASTATLVAFTGSTYPSGRPLWHLNLRGGAAAICLATFLACGITSERLQAFHDQQRTAVACQA